MATAAAATATTVAGALSSSSSSSSSVSSAASSSLLASYDRKRLHYQDQANNVFGMARVHLQTLLSMSADELARRDLSLTSLRSTLHPADANDSRAQGLATQNDETLVWHEAGFEHHVPQRLLALATHLELQCQLMLVTFTTCSELLPSSDPDVMRTTTTTTNDEGRIMPPPRRPKDDMALKEFVSLASPGRS